MSEIGKIQFGQFSQQDYKKYSQYQNNQQVQGKNPWEVEQPKYTEPAKKAQGTQGAETGKGPLNFNQQTYNNIAAINGELSPKDDKQGFRTICYA